MKEHNKKTSLQADMVLDIFIKYVMCVCVCAPLTVSVRAHISL